LIERGLVVLSRLENGSLEALRSHLRRNEVHIFHFVGHGKFLEAHEEGALLLENEQGQGKMVSGEQLGTILQDHHTLRLVVLNACEGARASEEDAYSGVAQALVRKGMPAVLAMQFPIHEQAAVRLALEFYTAIADGEPVDSALVDARKAIYTGDNDTEWGTPVLFMRIPNGLLFKIQPASKRRAQPAQQGAPGPAAGTVAPLETAEQMAERKRAANLTSLYGEAKKQIENQAWAAAIDLLEQVRRIDADYLESASLLQQAQAGLAQAARLQDLVAQAKRLIQEETPLKAIRVLQEALDLSPGHPEAAQLLEQATSLLEKQQETRRQQARLAELYGQAQERLTARAWPEAIKLLEELQRMEPGYQDSGALLQRAQAELDRAAKVGDLLTQARQLVQQERDYPRAIRTLQQLLALSPGHPEARQLLEAATSRLEQEEARLRRQAALEDSYRLASERLNLRDWDGAIQLLEGIEKDEPQYRDVNELLLQSRKEKARRAEQAGLLARASDHIQKRDWSAASALLQQALASDPGNPETEGLLAHAQKWQGIDELAAVAQKQAQDGLLRAAIATYEQILSLEPGDAGFSQQLQDLKRRLEVQENLERQKPPGKAVTNKPASIPEQDMPARPPALREETKNAGAARPPGPLQQSEPITQPRAPVTVTPLKPSSPSEIAKPARPGTLPEENRPRPRPHDTPE
jgi:outer membrane protein assembly factor BamD (BamD/ComL family)